MKESDHKTWKRGDTGALLLLFLAVLALFIPAMTGWLGIFHDDQAMAEFPWHYFVARHFQQGVIPLWEPDTWCGAIPFYARYYADTYYFPLWPLYLLADLTDLTQTYWLLSLIPLLLHYWLAAAGMYFFSRRSLLLHSFPAFLASWVYIFSPIFAYKYVAFPIVVVQAWLPWALTLVVSMDRKGGIMKIFGLAAIFSLMFFAAQPPHVGYSLLLAAVISFALAFRGWRRMRRLGAFRGPIRLLAALAISFLLAAVYVLPVLEGTEYTAQHLSFTYEDMTGKDGSMPPVYLATLFIPDLFGTWTGFHNRNWVESVTQGVRFWDANMSGGLLLTFLALTGLLLAVKWKQRPELRFWAILGGCLWLFSVLCMLGRHTPFYYLYYKVVPVLSDFPFPIRYVMIQAVVTAWLAGLGLESLLHRESPDPYPRPRLVWGYLCVAVLAAVLALYGLPGLQALLSGRLVITGLDEIIRRGNLVWFISSPVLYFFTAGFFLVLTWRVLRVKRRIQAVAGLVMLEAALLPFAAFYFCIFRFHEPQPQQVRSHGPAEHPMVQRILGCSIDLTSLPYRRWASDQPFHDNFARLNPPYHFKYAFMGYDMKPLEKRFKKAFEEAYQRPVDWSLYWEFPLPVYPSFLSNMSVADFIGSRPINPFPKGTTDKWKSAPDFYWHKNFRSLPRAFTLDRIVSCSEEEAMEELVKGDLRKGVFVGEGNQLSVIGDQGERTDYRLPITDYRFFNPGPREEYVAHFNELQAANPITRLDLSNPNRVKVIVESSRPAMLVLTEVWYPGWEAHVDGKSVPLYRVNYLQRGVWLEEGNHRVELVFRPRAWRIAAVVSSVSWGMMILGFMGYGLRSVIKARRPATGQRPSPFPPLSG